jgi:hypothetical protein
LSSRPSPDLAHLKPEPASVMTHGYTGWDKCAGMHGWSWIESEVEYSEIGFIFYLCFIHSGELQPCMNGAGNVQDTGARQNKTSDVRTLKKKLQNFEIHECYQTQMKNLSLLYTNKSNCLVLGD